MKHLMNCGIFYLSATLKLTLLSTNCRENAFSNWREATGKVKRRNLKGEMVSPWTASGILGAESGVRKNTSRGWARRTGRGLGGLCSGSGSRHRSFHRLHHVRQ